MKMTHLLEMWKTVRAESHPFLHLLGESQTRPRPSLAQTLFAKALKEGDRILFQKLTGPNRMIGNQPLI